MALDVEKLRNPEIREYMTDHFNYACRLVKFGAPALADVDLVVTTTNMKVGAYTVAAQPDVPRNATVTATAGATADTMGTIVFVGTDVKNQAITETITPVAGSTVAGLQAFKTFGSVTGVGWAIDETEATNDTITVGVGTVLGLPFIITATTQVILGALGVALIAPTVVADVDEISKCTADVSSGTYDGSKVAFAFVVE
jgi:hypothetical protein